MFTLCWSMIKPGHQRLVDRSNINKLDFTVYHAPRVNVILTLFIQILIKLRSSKWFSFLLVAVTCFHGQFPRHFNYWSKMLQPRWPKASPKFIRLCSHFPWYYDGKFPGHYHFWKISKFSTIHIWKLLSVPHKERCRDFMGEFSYIILYAWG